MPSWRSASPISPGSRACLSFSTLKRVVKGHGSCCPQRASLHTKPEKVECKCIRDLRNIIGMRIIDIQWRSYRLPFLHSFSTAHSVMTAREGIIVQVITSQGISGLGEIAPLPAFGGGSFADARTLLPALVARLQHKTLHEALDLVLAEGKTGTKAA